MGAVVNMLVAMILTFAIIFFLPDKNFLGISTNSGSGSSGDGSTPAIDTGVNPTKTVAEYQFNQACGNSLLRGCPLEDFQPVFRQCQIVYGNLTLEQCKSRCCDYKNPEASPPSTNPNDYSGGLNSPVGYIPDLYPAK
jgi:hypothetical protein